MLGLAFSSKLDWNSYIISIAKTTSKKIGALIHSMKFLSPEVALYLYKRTIWPCMEYYVVLHLLHFSVGITWVDVYLNWLNWFHFLILEGLLVILIDSMIFSVSISRCYKDVYVNSFFRRIARLWNCLPIECFFSNL